MSELATLDTMSLTAIADEINAIYSNVENEHMRTAILLAQAGRKFKAKYPDMDKNTLNAKFIKWAEKETPYSSNKIYRYVAVQNSFSNLKKTVDKSIPFSTLEALSSAKASNKTVNAVLKKFDGDKKITTAEVKKIIKKAQPPKPPKPQKPVPVVNPCFAERSKRSGSYVANPGYLLEVIPTHSAETVRILAKHWKQKYHPDRGGDADIFDRIVKAEQQLLKDRGEV